MELKLLNSRKKVELADDVFACDFNEALIHQIVTAYMAAGRAGTKAQKTRAEVSGGGVKPFRQKGTGRARAGTIRSPLWRTGGKVFAAKPRSYKQKVNKKMYKGALRSIFSELIRQERLVIVDSFQVDAPKTKSLLKKLTDMKVEGAALIVSDVVDENLYLSSRNLPHIEVRDAATSATDPVALIKVEKVIITEAAIKEIEGLLK
ncbi:50S ribosomal protein L4 [Aquicella lusitana]|uniref:Large ribosomal subunit protein uL4 n=1 Tax=Aquicella lusitana TaxID=254246 RepID=A0A370GUR3_9COXI|nr:50S ribosomal protein L4 [Aquicella lusitana]RDI46976.1 LSU ribosomal protein L4P [Aquicella lusitana]VVC73866.1 50S ribosomal protein L4 [Aquicella lusitana]